MKTYFKLNGKRISKNDLIATIGGINFARVLLNLRKEIVKNQNRFFEDAGVLTDVYAHTTIYNQHISARAKLVSDRELEAILAKA
jgi:hypothetical protein